MKKVMAWFLSVLLVLGLSACGSNTESGFSGQEENSSVGDGMENGTGVPQDNVEASVVYFTSDISPEGLMAVYEALDWEPTGRVAVKLSTGEPPASNYLDPQLIKELVQSVDGTIVECNTAYGGSRTETAMHMQVAEDHGFTAIANVDILDAEGSMELPVEGGIRLDSNLVGSHFADYDSHDIGIVASFDPVAIDQACIDLAFAAEGSRALQDRVNSRDGLHTLEHAEEIGLGSRTYELVNLDK